MATLNSEGQVWWDSLVEWWKQDVPLVGILRLRKILFVQYAEIAFALLNKRVHEQKPINSSDMPYYNQLVARFEEVIPKRNVYDNFNLVAATFPKEWTDSQTDWGRWLRETILLNIDYKQSK